MNRRQFLNFAVAGAITPVFALAKAQNTETIESQNTETCEQQASRVYNEYMDASAALYDGWYPDTSYFDYVQCSAMAKERGISEAELRLEVYTGFRDSAVAALKSTQHLPSNL